MGRRDTALGKGIWALNSPSQYGHASISVKHSFAMQLSAALVRSPANAVQRVEAHEAASAPLLVLADRAQMSDMKQQHVCVAVR